MRWRIDLVLSSRPCGATAAALTCLVILGCNSGAGRSTDAAPEMSPADTGASESLADTSFLIDLASADSTTDISGGTGGAAGTGGSVGTDGSAGTDGSVGVDRPTGTGGTSGSADASGSGGSDGSAGVDRSDAAGPIDRTADVGETGGCLACTAYGTPTMTGRVMPTDLTNLSGIAASWRNAGVLFAHNDRTEAHVFALGADGRQLARFALTNAGAMDIEDISLGPCPAGTCVYLADIGGNLSTSRVEFAIYRITEPAVPAGGTTATTNVIFERFRFAYPDSANHNAEGLLVDPQSGAIYVVTKVAAGQPSAVYGLPNPPSVSTLNVARKVADLSVPRSGDQPATSTSAHPCGLGFLLATNTAIYEFRIAAGASFESAFSVTPVAVPAGTEPQREAVTYRPDGRGYFSSGETASAPIFEAACQ